VFISIKFKETSIDKTNKIHQKVEASRFMFKMSTDECRIPVSRLTCWTVKTQWWVCDLSFWLCIRSAAVSMLSSWHPIRGLPLPEFRTIESHLSVFLIGWSDSSFCLKIHKYIYKSCNIFLYTQNYVNIFVREQHSFIYVNIMSPGKLCMWYVK